MSKNNTDWLVQALTGKSSSPISNYVDIVNHRTMFDDMGDAFTAQSQQPAINGKQRMTNALMAGMGAGFKGSQNNIRQQKLAQLEQYTKEVAEQQQRMAIQLGKHQYKRDATAIFAYDNYVDLKKLNDSLGSDDERTTNDLGVALFNRFSQQYPDLAQGMGQIDHVLNGKAYFTKGNDTKGVYLKDLLEPMVSSLPEEQQKELSNLLSLTTKNKFEKTSLLEDLTLQEKQASINEKNAHSNYYNNQGTQKKEKMSAADEFVYKQNRKRNEKFLDKLQENIQKTDPELKIKVLYKMKDILEEGTAFGGTPFDIANRWVKKAFGNDADIQEVKNLQKYFFKDIKGVAGNPNQKEWSDLITRIISGEQNVEAALNMIDFEIEQSNEMISKYDNYAELLADSDYQIPYDHPTITKALKEKGLNAEQDKENNMSIPDMRKDLGIK
jgi:hypothetical protein